jgi:hypothetical protein
MKNQVVRYYLNQAGAVRLMGIGPIYVYNRSFNADTG